MKKIKFVLFTILVVFSVHLTFAKGFGFDSKIVKEQCGDCVCIYNVEKLYIFWIEIGSTREFVGHDCSGVSTPQLL